MTTLTKSVVVVSGLVSIFWMLEIPTKKWNNYFDKKSKTNYDPI